MYPWVFDLLQVAFDSQALPFLVDHTQAVEVPAVLVVDPHMM